MSCRFDTLRFLVCEYILTTNQIALNLPDYNQSDAYRTGEVAVVEVNPYSYGKCYSIL
jgi:hypothetical protein